MATSNLLLNPYKPVPIPESEAPWHRFNPFARLEVDVTKGWLYRRFRLMGFIDSEVVWDARSATEYVKVAGQKVASRTSFLYVPRFEFEIPAGGRSFEAVIDVRIAALLVVAGFQFSVDGTAIYREGTL